jgi:hypothetical protein
VVVNASSRSYIIHHNQSGLSRPNHKGKRGRNKYSQCSKAINISKAWRKAINVFKHKWNLRQGIFHGSNALWNYVVVNASLRSHIIHHNQSGLSRPNHKGKRGRNKYSQRSKAINIFKAWRKAINIFKHKWNLRQGIFRGSNALCNYVVLMPH